MDRRVVAAVAGLVVAMGIGAGMGPAMAEPEPQAAWADFVDVAPQAGLDFTCEHWAKFLGLAPRWFNDVFFCASPALGDFNGDGYTDLYFPNTRFSNKTLNDERDPQDALFLNNGDGTFTDASRFVGLADRGYSNGAAAIDHDDDGDLDVIVANFREIPLGFQDIRSPAFTVYRNDGEGVFTRLDPAALGLVTDTRCYTRAGLTSCFLDAQFGVALAAADYDRDGDLDLFRGNYAQYDMRTGMPAGLQLTTPDTNNLYRNNGDGTFTEVTLDAGTSLVAGRTFAVNFVDLDHDLWPDLYVANDENPNEVYRNLGDGTFLDVSSASGADDPRGSMCSEAADFSGDGHLDLYMSHYETEHNGYYLGHGDLTFTEASTLGDLGKSFHILGWACPALDVDNDGDLDLFVANGHMLPPGGENIFPGDPEDDNGYELPNFLFRNTLRETGTHSFVDARSTAGPGLKDRFVSSGAAAADFDLDGKVEIVVVENNNVPTKLYANRAPVAGHWLQVELRGVQSNSHGIGAKVVVQAGALTLMDYMKTGNTLASGSAAPLRFGLGAHTGPVQVTVHWPSGVVQQETVGVDLPVRIVEGQGIALDTLAPRVTPTLTGTRGANGWWTSPTVTVALHAEDRGVGAQSGLATLAYRVDGGAAQPYQGPFVVQGEGRHEVTLLASDLAGNSAWYPLEVWIDSVAPLNALLTPEEGKVHVQDRIVGDSPDGTTIIVAPAKTPNEDAAMLDQFAQGTAQEIKRRLGIPLALPLLTLALQQTVGSDGLTRVSIQGSDATSGLAHATFALDGEVRRVDKTAPFTWDVDLRGLAVGEHVLTATLTDHAGLATTAQAKVLVVPTTHDGALTTLQEATP
jgi:enediyne biosynthesis protein E4